MSGRLGVAALLVALVAVATLQAVVLLRAKPLPFAGSGAKALSFAGSGVDLAGARRFGGQTESYAAFLTAAPAGHTFVVRKVSLIPLPGFRTPELAGAVLLWQDRNVPLHAAKFPPVRPARTAYPVRPFPGRALRSGTRPDQAPVVLMYGLRGPGFGGYAVAGIRLVYTTAGHTFTTTIYNGALLFYYHRHETPARLRASLARYAELNSLTSAVLQNLPGARAVLAASR